ncbi:MAG: glycoside hydrolase family 16 protein [Bacteroidaceae bacterium]|nr:glycoside hydrolase family 16 protein [Bacteroidaceae bacterium]
MKLKRHIGIGILCLLWPLAAMAEGDDRRPTSDVRQYEGYTLVWQDEFDKDGRPAEHWSYERGFVRNRELQWYQPDNATVEGGVLIIEGRREAVPNPQYEEGSEDWRRNRKQAEYTSSSLTTKKSFRFRYGRVEVRAMIPTASGSWPAIWLLGNRWGWPSCGEIDMMEYYIANGVPSVLANACWAGERRFTPVWDSVAAPLSHFTDGDADWTSKFHTWRMDWDEDFIRLYLDDELLNTIDLSLTTNRGGDGRGMNPFSNEWSSESQRACTIDRVATFEGEANEVEGFGMYLLLNLAIGENGGTPDDSQFPLRYLIDYVRVYAQL